MAATKLHPASWTGFAWDVFALATFGAGKGFTEYRSGLLSAGPDSPDIIQRGADEGIGDAMPLKIRNALTLRRPLRSLESVEYRLHRTILYNLIYRVDDHVMVNQHTYGVPAAHAPAFCLRISESGEMRAGYLEALERIWGTASPIRSHRSRSDGRT